MIFLCLPKNIFQGKSIKIKESFGSAPRATKLLPASYFSTKFEPLSEWMKRVMGRGRGHIWGGIDLKLAKEAIFNVEWGAYLGGHIWA